MNESTHSASLEINDPAAITPIRVYLRVSAANIDLIVLTQNNLCVLAPLRETKSRRLEEQKIRRLEIGNRILERERSPSEIRYAVTT